jgi:hypothetical protein
MKGGIYMGKNSILTLDLGLSASSANPGFATVHSIAGCNMGPLVCSAL